MSAAQNTPQTHRRVVSYIDKSREYYAANGYDQPYRWASYDTVPFEPWGDRDLSQARIGVVTTTYPKGDEFKSKPAYAYAADPIPESMYTSYLSWDKDATHTDDVGSFLPLAVLEQLADEGVTGRPSPRFYGAFTAYSQRRTAEDAAEILAWAREDQVDAMLLVAL
ncbi:MAG: hypothetical protein AAF567_07200 [Actinomycetota bacterium]